MSLPLDVVRSPLQAVVGEIELHVDEQGWDQPTRLFALVPTEDLLRSEPTLAQTMGLLAGDPASLTPVEQELSGEGPLDDQLAAMLFGDQVLGVVVAQEVVVLPPSAEAALQEVDDLSTVAHDHPGRRDVRMVVGVVRGGERACLLRLRGGEPSDDERVTGPDLAPNLAGALLATLED